MKKVWGNSPYGGYVYHFDDDELGDIYYSIAQLGESIASVAKRYEVSPSVIRRVWNEQTS